MKDEMKFNQRSCKLHRVIEINMLNSIMRIEIDSLNLEITK